MGSLNSPRAVIIRALILSGTKGLGPRMGESFSCALGVICELSHLKWLELVCLISCGLLVPSALKRNWRS